MSLTAPCFRQPNCVRNHRTDGFGNRQWKDFGTHTSTPPNQGPKTADQGDRTKGDRKRNRESNMETLPIVLGALVLLIVLIGVVSLINISKRQDGPQVAAV